MAEGEGSIALVAGASGLTGGFTLDALLAAPDVSRVIAVTRRPSTAASFQARLMASPIPVFIPCPPTGL